jgi:hypothetical protein
MKKILVNQEHADALQRIGKASGKEPHEVFHDMVNAKHEETFGIPVPGHASSAGTSADDELEREHQQNAARVATASARASEDAPGAKAAALKKLDAVGASDDESSSTEPNAKKESGRPHPLKTWATGKGRGRAPNS